jgi:hypothetical protein
MISVRAQETCQCKKKLQSERRCDVATTKVVSAEPHLKSIKVAITNPTDENRPAEEYRSVDPPIEEDSS